MSQPSHTLVVFGATGNQGSAVVRGAASYFTSDSTVRAVTRDPSSAKTKRLLDSMKVADGAKLVPIKADLDSAAEVKEAIKGADAVFLNTNTFLAPDEEVPRAKALIDAAAAPDSTVRLFIWSHLPSVAEETNGKYTHVKHFDQKDEITKYLQHKSEQSNGKMRWAAIALGWFSSNLKDYHLIQPKSDGGQEWVVSWLALRGDVQLPWTCVEHDVAETTKAILHSYDSPEKKLIDRIVHATGMRPTMDEFVEEVKKQTGVREITYTPTGPGGNDELDEMVYFYNDYGLYKGIELPEKDLVDEGAKLMDLPTFVRENIVPLIKGQ